MKKVMKAFFLLVAIVTGGCNSFPLDESSSPKATPEERNEKTVTLSFNSVTNEQQIQKINKLENGKIVKEQSVAGGMVIIFTKQDDDENIYAAFKTTKDDLYELGVVCRSFPNLDDELLSIKELNLNNKLILRIKGVYGANSPVQNYFSIENGNITPFLRIDTGYATELDLDGDGNVEIISSHGTSIQTYIYKWEDGTFSVTNINELLGAASVQLNEEKRLFNAWFKDSHLPEQFMYKSGVLKSFS